MPVIKKYNKDFFKTWSEEMANVLGFLFADGNVWVGNIHTNRRNPVETMQVSFTSASQYFLEGLHQMCRKNGVQGGSLFRSKSNTFSRLNYSKNDALKIHEIMYNADHKLYLKRKKSVFERFVKNTRR